MPQKPLARVVYLVDDLWIVLDFLMGSRVDFLASLDFLERYFSELKVPPPCRVFPNYANVLRLPVIVAYRDISTHPLADLGFVCISPSRIPMRNKNQIHPLRI